MSDPPLDPSSMSYKELQQACKLVGLPAQGRTEVLREMLEAYLEDPEEALRKYRGARAKKKTKDGWVDWINHPAREILMEDIEPNGWLYTVDYDDAEDDSIARDIYDIYRSRHNEFKVVPFDQFEARYKDATKAAARRRARSAQEEEWLAHDRLLHPRQSHNHRGEPVFDMDIEAKEQLREDIKNKAHLDLTLMELWELRDVYSKYKLDIFRQRIYQEICRIKYLNYLEKKQTKKRREFAANNVSFNRN